MREAVYDAEEGSSKAGEREALERLSGGLMARPEPTQKPTPGTLQ